MEGVWETLTKIAVWVLFINGVINILGPAIMGLATKNLAGTIHSVEDGKIWFYRHGLGFLIGILSLVAAVYAMSAL
jgi:hypothetical protein